MCVEGERETDRERGKERECVRARKRKKESEDIESQKTKSRDRDSKRNRESRASQDKSARWEEPESAMPAPEAVAKEPSGTEGSDGPFRRKLR